jgi:hypothetical protein
VPFQLSRKIILLLGLLAIFIILTGYITYIETQNNAPQTTCSPTTIYTNTTSSNPLITNYSITIPEFQKVGFGIAEIQIKFIAPSPTLQIRQPVSEANYSTTKLPLALSTNPIDETNPILPPILNGTTIDIKVNVYHYTMITDNPRILAATQEWTETKYVYA